MEFGFQFYLIAALIVFLSGISKAGFGAGVEMMAVPMMALFIAPQTAAAIMLPLLIAIDIANLWRYRRDWQMRILILLVPAAVIGIAVGGFTFSFVNADLFKLGIGLLALGFLAQRLLGGNEAKSEKPIEGTASLFLGALGGFTSFVSHAGGPPIKMVLLSHDLSNKEFVATNSYLFAIINFLKLFPYLYLGQFSTTNLTVSLQLAPFVPIGVMVGFWLNRILSPTVFNRIILYALGFAGIKLTWDGLLALV